MTSLSEQELDYSETISPGYRFRPTDTELIVEYLLKKVDGRPLPRNKIMDVDLYKFHPDVLAATYSNYGDNGWYFFTPRDKRFRNGSVPNRSARGGYWKSVRSEKRIRRHDGVIIGRRKVLVFYMGKPPKGEKTDWIMYEFKLENAPPTRVPKMNPNTEEPNIRLDDSVLCRIYKTSGRSNYIRRYEAEEKYKYDEEINDARADELGDNHEITGGLEHVFHSDSPPASSRLLPLGDYDSPGFMADQPTPNYFPPPEGTYSDQPPPNDFPTLGSSYIYSDLPPSDDFLLPGSSYSYSDQPPFNDFFLPGSNYSYSDQLEKPLARFAYDSYHHDHHNVEMTGSGEDRWIHSACNESPYQHQQSPYQHQPSPNQQHQHSAGSNISLGD
ncbi:NAC domain-containing protein 71-like [Mercurialis annua]|uniref:NAC domain-containing protein 71-like n=1 Tax=Mercurialis annua TaxID=3986 RepID=UPI00215E2ECC|nr:NAC domain-containing protein 71-like [Mercurialis annua]